MKPTHLAFPVLTAGLALSIACTAAPVSGVVYDDTNHSSVSDWVQPIDAGDVRLAGVGVALLGTSGERNTVTDTIGGYLFDAIPDGTYLVTTDVAPDVDSTSNNRPTRLPAAIRDGHVHLVHLGDSLGVVGPEPRFPTIFAEHLSAIAPTTVDNVAVGGSTTRDWLPGAATGFFENDLAPRLADADVVTITLGGNDLDVYLGNPPDYDPIHVIERFLADPEYLFQIYPNLATIIAAIRAINPTCDVVYFVYPNYANSTAMKGYIGDLQPLASLAFGVALGAGRQLAAENPGIVIADVYTQLGNAWLDPYLIDEVHLSAAGHQVFADVLFRALGGVDAVTGQAVQRSFGFDGPAT
ncbi:MAG: hypothetical protein IPK07_26075 [Deltaproteobacteria bacterium]|jgi:lysophospholipase L1-like esterase|nr:hypothetical protein [Deltaproteobacteria bacterium]